ncbi:MAG: hypothetical protein RL329_2309 [Bacteroidota bacterium]|jgi:hypothetical protein
MGKVLVSLLMCCFLALDVFGQAAPAAAAPAQTEPAKKTVTRGRKKAAPAADAAATPAPVATPAPTVTPAPTATTTPAATPAVTKEKKTRKAHTAAAGTATSGTDKLIGKDAKGHEIYQGPKGGQYYLSNGNKQYLAKDEKLKL